MDEGEDNYNLEEDNPHSNIVTFLLGDYDTTIHYEKISAEDSLEND